MLNLFTRKTPWLVASLLAATVAFTQDNNNAKCRSQKGFDQGHEMMQNQMMPAYNAPARVEVRGSWDVYATGSFIYWQARQDNMELGYISNYSTPFTPTAGGIAPTNNLVLSNFTYKPGFKFGLGVNLDWDNWDAYAEYTWFHGTTTTGVSPLVASPAAAVQGAPNFLFPTQQQAAYNNGSNYYFNSANQIWNLKMDFLDISLARSSYSGMKLSVRPFFGARGAWIRQSLENSYNANLQDPNASTGSNLTGDASYTSWGVGPRAGFESNWMMGYGFRVIGNGSADILYTRYDLRNLGNLVAVTSAIMQRSGNFYADHLDVLRPHAALELGFGWGSYFDNNNWHTDLSATYGYQVFWDQDMFMFAGNSNVYLPNGNLYVHGLNLTARLDF